MSRHLLWFVLAAIVVPTTAAAQHADPLVGQRVRVVYQCEEDTWRRGQCREEGTVRATDADSLRLDLAGNARWAIPSASVAQVWVRDGTRSHFWAGVGVGFLSGALLGTAIGATQEFCIFTCSSAAPIGFMLGAPVGMLIGGVVGAVIRTDRWRPLEGNGAGVRARAVGNGVGVGLEVAF
ncbi:MAG TPA: hypothetical protein VGA02_05565 [Gemmatimonadales bacterium]